MLESVRYEIGCRRQWETGRKSVFAGESVGMGKGAEGAEDVVCLPRINVQRIHCSHCRKMCKGPAFPVFLGGGVRRDERAQVKGPSIVKCSKHWICEVYRLQALFLR